MSFHVGLRHTPSFSKKQAPLGQTKSALPSVTTPRAASAHIGMAALAVISAAITVPAKAQQMGSVAGLTITGNPGQNSYVNSSTNSGGTGHIFMQMPESNNLFRVYAGNQNVLQATGSNLSTYVPLMLMMANTLSDPFTPFIREVNQLNGTVAQGPVDLNILQAQDNIAAPQGLSVLNVTDFFGGSATTGVRNALQVNAQLVATTGNSTSGGTAASGEQVTMTAGANDGGTAQSAAGAIWGVNHVVGLNGTASNFIGVVGNETDIYLSRGTSTLDKYGINVVQIEGDAAQGSRDDAGIAEGNQPGNPPGWSKGLSFGTWGGYFPIAANGAMISAQGHVGGTFSVANGVDWHLGTFTGNSWNDGHIYLTGSGHIGSTGTIPTLSSCGTGATLDSTASDLAGTVTPGNESVFTSCTITFAKPFTTPPHCGLTAWTSTAPYIVSETTTQLVVHAGTNKFSYHGCTQ